MVCVSRRNKNNHQIFEHEVFIIIFNNDSIEIHPMRWHIFLWHEGVVPLTEAGVLNTVPMLSWTPQHFVAVQAA